MLGLGESRDDCLAVIPLCSLAHGSRGVMHLSIKTISTHKRRIQDKLQLPNTAALVRYGMAHGLADDMPG